jgi:hypothetical protein
MATPTTYGKGSCEELPRRLTNGLLSPMLQISVQGIYRQGEISENIDKHKLAPEKTQKHQQPKKLENIDRSEIFATQVKPISLAAKFQICTKLLGGTHVYYSSFSIPST